MAIRTDYQNMVVNATTADGIFPDSHTIFDLFARHLHAKFQFARGLEEAKEMLKLEFLTPCQQKKPTDPAHSPTVLKAFFQRSIPRCNESMRVAAWGAFMRSAAVLLKIGTMRDVGKRQDELCFFPADAKKCLDNNWFMSTVLGRAAMLAAVHAALARLKVLARFHVKATAQVEEHYCMRYELYARIVVLVRSGCGIFPFSSPCARSARFTRRTQRNALAPKAIEN